MINKKSAKKFCSEDISLIENYQKAVADQTQTWDCHHRREIDENKTRKQLIQENLYDGRPASELIFLTKTEHSRLHNKGKKYFFGKHHSPETRVKMSAARKGENHPMFGKHHSPEARTKISAALKGKPTWNKGKHHSPEARTKISTAKKGCHFWNNGIKNKCCKVCPGPEWTRGRI